MSFILDALKKSESDRQQQGSTEFAGVPTRPQNAVVPRWIWLVAALLAINLAVLIGLLLRPGPTLTSSPAAVVQSQSVNRADDQPIASAEQQVEPTFTERVATARRNAPAQQPSQPSANDTIAVGPPAEDTVVQPVLISQNPDAIPASSIYPTYQEVIARGYINLRSSAHSVLPCLFTR